MLNMPKKNAYCVIYINDEKSAKVLRKRETYNYNSEYVYDYDEAMEIIKEEMAPKDKIIIAKLVALLDLEPKDITGAAAI